MVETSKKLHPGISRDACIYWLRGESKAENPIMQQIIEQLNSDVDQENSQKLRVEYESASPLERAFVIDKVAILVKRPQPGQ